MTEHDEPLVLINLFTMPPELVDGFVAAWETNIAVAKDAKGFRGTRLHRAIDPDASYPLVNIARWDSVEDWQATVSQHFSQPGTPGSPAPAPVAGTPTAHPALYTVVHATADPRQDIGETTAP